MFRKIECLVPVCDRCEKDVDDGGDFLPHYETEDQAKDMLDNSEAYEIHGRLLCSRCWEYDDDDEMVEKAQDHKPQ